MNVVAVKVDKNNKVNITLEELNKMLNDVYNEGYQKGQENTRLYIPSITQPTSPTTPNWAYCKINVDDDLTVSGTNTRVKEE